MYLMEKRVTLRVRGRVQGVFYRAAAREQAELLGLRGGVRNRLDRSVELWAEGDEGELAALLRWCAQGPPAARVDAIDVVWSEPIGEDEGFVVASTV